MRTVVAIRHVAFEDLGLLGPILERKGMAVRYRDAGVDAVDDVGDPDLLVVLGGPIGAYDEELYPFLAGELAMIARRLAARRPTLGICLGAQLMARASGAEVRPGPAKEIGWATLDLTAEGLASPLRHLHEVPVLHWHGDVFGLPAGARRLASTALTPNQGFLGCDGKALGLQFHLEATAGGLERWFIGHAAEIAATPGVTVPGLREDTRRFSAACERQGAKALEEWLATVG